MHPALRRVHARAAAIDAGPPLALAFAAGFAALAFVSQGGVALEQLTWSEIAVVLDRQRARGARACRSAQVRDRRRRSTAAGR